MAKETILLHLFLFNSRCIILGGSHDLLAKCTLAWVHSEAYSPFTFSNKPPIPEGLPHIRSLSIPCCFATSNLILLFRHKRTHWVLTIILLISS